MFISTTQQVKNAVDAMIPEHAMMDIEHWASNATMTAGHLYSLTTKARNKTPLWPHELMPYFGELEWAKMKPKHRRTLEAKGAMSYLAVTDHIEPVHVMPVAERLAAGGKTSLKGLYVPPVLQGMLDAVVTDEALHKTVSSHLVRQTGIEPDFVPDYAARYDCMASEAVTAGREADVMQVLFVCVTETCITKFLGYATQPSTCYDAGLKASIVAHKSDEARHHFVFGKVFQILFRQMPDEMKAAYACWLPRCLKVFLGADRAAARFVMHGVFDAAEIEARIDRAYPEHEEIAGIVKDGRAVVRLARQCGLLDFAQVRQAFIDEGMEESLQLD